MLRAGPLPSPAPVASALAVDHIGVVVRDLDAEVAAWRQAGFLVSDPSPLMGADAGGRPVPVGQSSAHVVFANAYVELSSPVPGSGNHLEPYLARGEGVRILVLATADADASHASLLAQWPDLPPVRPASRAVAIDGRKETATFRWFPLPQDVVAGVLSAIVEHGTRDRVLHPSLCQHPNGLRRLDSIVATGDAGPAGALAGLGAAPPDAPRLAFDGGAGPPAIRGITLSPPAGAGTFFRLG